jgi:type I restriction enzyme S subunit
MSFPRYSKYKDSGHDWLGPVPSHWSVAKFRHSFFESPEKIEREVVGPMLSVSGYRGVEVKEYDDENRKRTDEELIGYRIVRPGQLVVNTMWLNYAGLGVSQHEGHVSPAYRSYWISEALDRRYAHHLMRSSVYVGGYTKFITGIRPNSLQMGREDLMVFPVMQPPKREQSQIADFLDAETAKIDALVGEQEKLIALLKEKRQAVISQAITRGLNPNAPMKSSGIEWLGDVPEHWDVKRLKYLGEAITGLTYSPNDTVDDETMGTLVLRSSNVQGGLITFDDNVYVSTSIPDELVTQIGDILICSRNGSRALIGKNATIDEKSAGLTFGAFMTIFRSKHSAYLSYVLNSPLFEFQSGAFMTSTINQLTIGVLNNFEVPLPPEDERAEIAAFLAIESSRFDTLITEAQRAIALLQERRTALISAAVTGQIDVRGTR